MPGTRSRSRSTRLFARRPPSVRPRRRRREVALLIETSNGYGRGLLNGIIAYIREHESWSVYLGEHGRGDDPPRWLRRWRGDGIIARIENDRIAAAVVESGLPAVDVSAARKVERLPWVETDDRAIAEAAARHLLERSFRQLAYCGDDRFNWSRWRGEHFRRAAEAAGVPCAEYVPVRPRPPRLGRDGGRDRPVAAVAAGAGGRDGRATTSARATCSTRAAAWGWPCRTRWRWWGWTTTSSCATWPTRRCPASPPTAAARATRRPRCSTG